MYMLYITWGSPQGSYLEGIINMSAPAMIKCSIAAENPI